MLVVRGLEFETTEYRFAHGRSPRGRGTWTFDVPCKGGVERLYTASSTYGEAKKLVAELVTRLRVTRRVEGRVVVQVLP